MNKMFTSSRLKILAVSITCIFCCMNVTVSVAAAFQSHNSIYQAVQKFISAHIAAQPGKRVKVTTGKLDSRLKLDRCDSPLQAFLPEGSRALGKTTVGVKCSDSKPWSLHVPVTISIYSKVLVATRTLQKNEVLTPDDIKLAEHDLSSLAYGYFEDISAGVGLKIKKRALAGDVLTPSMLKKPMIIKRGQKISIVAESGSMEVRMMGEALNNGAVGDRIKVMNVKSRQKLDAIVLSSAEVKVDI